MLQERASRPEMPGSGGTDEGLAIDPVSAPTLEARRRGMLKHLGPSSVAVHDRGLK